MSRSRTWLFITGAVLGTLILLGALGAGYWKYANTLPPFQPPAVTMPAPNAREDFAAARQLAAGLLNDSAAAFDEMSLARHRQEVERMQPALRRLRIGLRKPFISPFPASTNQAMPEMSEYRHLARCLAAEGALAEREGRLADAARSYLDCMHLGAKLPRGGAIIHELVANAVSAIGHARLHDLADRLDAKTAAQTARELGRIEQARPSLAEILTTEREFGVLGMYEMLRTPHPWRDMTNPGATTPPSLAERWEELRFSFTPKSAMLQRYRRYMDAVIAASRKPYHAGPLPPPPPDPYVGLLPPVADAARESWVRQEALSRVLMTRLAARAYGLEHGKAAPALEGLVPRYLSAVPEDPFAPRPLTYRVVGGEVLIYSYGPDGDDDGGRGATVAGLGTDGDLNGPLRRRQPGRKR
jgi:hypothetical protein